MVEMLDLMSNSCIWWMSGPQCDPNKLAFGMKVWFQNSQLFLWHEGPIMLASTISLTWLLLTWLFQLTLHYSSTLHEVIFDLSIPFFSLLFFLVFVRKSYSHLNSFHDCYVRFVVYIYSNWKYLLQKICTT
jgi:hypothetical protein